MKQKDRVCCIILNWNSPDHTIACLTSLKSQDLAPDTIIVCDNASTDNSGRQIRGWASQAFDHEQEVQVLTAQAVRQKRFPRKGRLPEFVFIQNSENQGFARGNNLCIQWALARESYSFIWMLNADTRPAHSALPCLHRCAQARKKVGIWGSTVCSAQKPDVLQCAAGCTYTPWNTLIRPVLGGVKVSHAINIQKDPHLDYIIGASMFLKVDALEHVGYLCEDFFLFYEELDLCFRLNKFGYELGWCRESRVYHHGGTTFEAQAAATKARQRRIAYHETLSTLIYTHRYYPQFLLLVLLARLAGKFCCLLKRGQLKLMGPLLRAYVDFVAGNWKKTA